MFDILRFFAEITIFSHFLKFLGALGWADWSILIMGVSLFLGGFFGRRLYVVDFILQLSGSIILLLLFSSQQNLSEFISFKVIAIYLGIGTVFSFFMVFWQIKEFVAKAANKKNSIVEEAVRTFSTRVSKSVYGMTGEKLARALLAKDERLLNSYTASSTEVLDLRVSPKELSEDAARVRTFFGDMLRNAYFRVLSPNFSFLDLSVVPDHEDKIDSLDFNIFELKVSTSKLSAFFFSQLVFFPFELIRFVFKDLVHSLFRRFAAAISKIVKRYTQELFTIN